MLNMVLTPLETAINQYLRLDPNVIARLGELENKIIQLSITDWNLEFTIEPSTNGVNIYPADKTKVVDTIIKGRLSSLVRIGLKSDMSNKTLMDNQITISGDHRAGEALRSILKEIDIDWEDHLANITNDGFAHIVTQKATSLFHFAQQALHKLKGHAHDYLHQELQVTPAQDELTSFYGQVRQVREAADRIETKINRLSAQNKKETPYD